MYELIILSLLMRRSAHGYLIAKVINDMIGPLARASNGRIYPLLSKLEGGGLIAGYDEELEGGRRARVFAITDQGRERFHALMMETTSNPREYRELFAFKVGVLQLLQPAERLLLIDHYTEFCRAHIRHLRAEAADLLEHREVYYPDPMHVDKLLTVIEHRIQQWELELAWAGTLRGGRAI